MPARFTPEPRKARGLRTPRLGLAMSVAVLGLMLVPAAHASTIFTVTTTIDDATGVASNCVGEPVGSSCSLRDAVAAANAHPGATIELGAQTYVLTHGELNLTASVTIAGHSASATEIDQHSAGSRVLEVDPVAANSSVTVSGIEITGGDVTGTAAIGGGILIDPTPSGLKVTLASDVVTLNEAFGTNATTTGTNGGSAQGAGIAVASTGASSLTLTDTTVSVNSARAGAASSSNSATTGKGGQAEGGGVEFASAGTLTVTGGAISGNFAIGGNGEPTTNTSGHEGGDGGSAYGGGLMTIGTLDLSGATIENDTAEGGTGGGAAGTQGDDGSGGSAGGGGILAEGSATIAGAEIAGNQIEIGAPGSSGTPLFSTQGEGGGVEFANPKSGADSGSVTISASTIAHNTASDTSDGVGVGGGISDAAAKFTLVNSTVEGNSARGEVPNSHLIEGFGGGLAISEGSATLASDTIAGNETTGSGGNLHAQFATVTATDTIVADGTSGETGTNNCHNGGASIGDLSGHGNNLESDATGECGFTAPSDVHAEPQLGSLALNGGSTETMLPTGASPVIAAGAACIDPTTSGPLAVDQRGELRPSAGACDIGAVQVQPLANTVIPTISGTAAVGQALTCKPGTWSGDGTLSYAYQWLRDGAPVTSGAAYVVVSADAGHALTCSVTAESPYGKAAAASVPVTVPPTGPGSSTGPPPPSSAIVSSFHQSSSKWRRSGKSAKHKPPVGTKFTFELNEAASVKLTFTQAGSGRKVSGKCVASTHKNRKKPSCTLVLGVVTIAGKAGSNSIKFAGKLPGGKKLKPGRYTVTITAKATNGTASKPSSLEFTIAN